MFRCSLFNLTELQVFCPLTIGMLVWFPTMSISVTLPLWPWARHSPILPAGGAQRGQWRQWYGNLTSVSLPQGSWGCSVDHHHHSLNGSMKDCSVKCFEVLRFEKALHKYRPFTTELLLQMFSHCVFGYRLTLAWLLSALTWLDDNCTTKFCIICFKYKKKKSVTFNT